MDELFRCSKSFLYKQLTTHKL